MRCHYLSDLHLERQSFDARLPKGDLLIIAGDLCNARCFDAPRHDRYHTEQRERVLRFIEHAQKRFANVLMVAGNHEHYNLVMEDTIALMRRSLPGVIICDDECVEIGGFRFFGTTFWTNFNGGDQASMDRVRRKRGEYFFIKTRAAGAVAKFQPEDALEAHRNGWSALRKTGATGPPDVIVTHHAPSLQGLCRRRRSTELDCTDASDLDHELEALSCVRFLVHGHTHIARTYNIGAIKVCSNAFGLPERGMGPAGFSVDACFEL
ncbi:MAG: metallophosphoesterase [Hyphomicrobiaceae bacterium]|nr:metallophosphoesterase [Hyphomicrobiaceae bacterium]